jgi:hypothetical protein
MLEQQEHDKLERRKASSRKANAKWVAKNKEKTLEYAKKSRANPALKAKAKLYRQSNQVHIRKQSRYYTAAKYYGLSPDKLDQMINNQDNKCAICSQEFIYNVKPSRMVVDHCHATNQVRSLLCSGCNVSIGGFKEDVNIMANAIKYLQLHKGE